jgi:nucleoside-diphosphate kinase
MTVQRTLSIIKPDATKRNLTGQINSRFEAAGLSIVAQKRMLLTAQQAATFYISLNQMPFYNDLIDFMISGPVVVQVLEGEDAVLKNRELMGATNPAQAAAGTIRADFAQSIDANSVHGSDALESAEREVKFFFSDLELYPNKF